MSSPTTLTQKLLKVQQSIAAVAKSSDNKYFGSKYADLNEVLSVAKSALNPAGLVLVQGAGFDGQTRYVESTIIDSETSQSISCRVPFSGNEKNMQEIGAAITYGRRFGVKSLLAMEDDDDDGETAVGRGQQNKAKLEPAQPVRVEGVQRESSKAVPKGVDRKALLNKISLVSKVAVDSKKATTEELFKMLEGYKAKTKEDLTDAQAQELLTKLEEKLK